MNIDTVFINCICISFICSLISADQLFLKAIKSPSVEVRGVYLSCNQEHKRTKKTPSQPRSFNKCSRKISISVKLINVGPSQIQDEFLVMNHVFDPIANASSQLLNPIIFKVNQKPITEVYDLKHLTRINGEAKEVIKQAMNSKTCRHSGAHPVCGSQHLRSHKDCCCTCPSTKNLEDSRELIKRSSQHQSNSTPSQYTEGSTLPNSETAELLKKEYEEDLSGISNVHTDKTLHGRRRVDDTPPLKDQKANQVDDGPRYFAKKDSRMDKYPYSTGIIKHNILDNLPHKSLVNYLSQGYGRSEIQRVSKLRKNSHNIFLEGASHYDSESYDENSIENKEIHNFHERGKGTAKEETNKHGYDKYYNLNKKFHDNIPYSNDDSRENILDDSEHKNEGIEKKSAVKFAGKENVSPIKYYDEKSSNFARQANEYPGFHDAIPQHKLNVFNGEDSQPSNAPSSEEKNVRGTHSENLVIVPKGEKLSRINIGIEYEPKGKDDVSIDLQNLHPDANKNTYARGRKNKTCENTFDLHCLTFSNLWYNVYEFKKPKIKHIVEVEIFERQYNGESKTDWIDHTKGKVLRLGSVDDGTKNEFDGSLRYKVLEKEENQSLNPSSQKLLVPQMSEEIEIPNHPGISEGNPGEYLVLPKHLLSLDGSKCDRAGVGVKTFISSKDRCSAEQGSCLRNQPVALWQKDKDAKNSGGKTLFFLENFGKISNDSYRAISPEHSLQLGYNGKHISQIDVVVSVESNPVIQKGPAQITSVIADATEEVPTITVAVTNLGLGSASFSVELGECIPKLASASKPSSSGYKSMKLMISPLHQTDFMIQLCEGFPNEKTRCIVLVKSEDNKTIAARRITIEKGTRCLCAWHCQCNCILSELNLECRLMPHDELLASGFKGTIPVVLPIVPTNSLVAVLANQHIDYLPLYFILFLILLLLLGLCKVVLGLTYWEEVWVVGIPYYYCTKTTEECQEERFANHKRQYDKTGNPAHPDTKKRSANKCNRFGEFLMNIFMFLFLPFVFLIWLPMYMCFVVFCRNCAGYYWKFSVSKFAAKSNTTSETSSFIPEDTESTHSRSLNEENMEGTPSKSKSKSTNLGASSRPTLPETVYGGTHQHSHISFVTYDGTSDEQEIKDIDYVMLQMKRSSSALQKARDRTLSFSGGRRIFLAESIDEEGSLSDTPSSYEIEIIPESICKRRVNTNNTVDTSRNRSVDVGDVVVRDVLSTADDILSEVTTKDSLEAVTVSEAGLSSTAAQEFVERLRSKKFIFRNIDNIAGGVNFPEGRPYSIRGYFFNAPGGYKFIPPTPLWQYWTVEEDRETVVELDPPVSLLAAEFEKFYDSAQTALEEGDLSMLPISTCINVQFQHFDSDDFLL